MTFAALESRIAKQALERMVVVENLQPLPDVVALSSKDFRKLFKDHSSDEKLVRIGKEVFHAVEMPRLKEGQIALSNFSEWPKDRSPFFVEIITGQIMKSNL